MQPFKRWKFSCIAISALVGAVYGALMMRNTSVRRQHSLWNLVVSSAGLGAFCASVAAAVCRFVNICQVARTLGHGPSDSTLMYRGTRVEGPLNQASTALELPQKPNVEPLCYRGVRFQPADLLTKEACAPANRWVDPLLFYRGTAYPNPRVDSAA